MKKRVVAVESIHPDGLALLHARDDVEVEVLKKSDQAAIPRAVARAHGVIVRTARLTDEILAPATDLRVVSKHGVGCDNIAVDHLSARGIPVAIAAEANALSVAEHVMMLLLALTKRAGLYDRAVREGRFQERGQHRTIELSGRTILVVGFGRIGKRVAGLCRAFGMRVIVADIALDHQAAADLGCEAVEDFRRHLGDADFLTVHVPLKGDTENLIGADELSALKDQAMLINCARGRIVDEAAVAAALDAGRLAGAGFDVFAEEPPPVDHPLFAQANVILSPHSAASTEEAMRRMARAAAQSVLDQFDGTLRPDFIFNREHLQAT